MALTPDQHGQLDRYGVLLDGTETELELEKLRRLRYLKQKFRPHLKARIGDSDDTIADVARALALGMAIQRGHVSDDAVVATYDAYVGCLLEAYGGAAAIAEAVRNAAQALQEEMVDGYYAAKAQIAAADSVDGVRRVDLPGELIPESAA